MRQRLSICLLAVVALCVACSRPTQLPGEFIAIDNAEWPYGKSLVFNSAADTLTANIDHVDVSVRHTDAYAYANLWLEMAYESGDSTVRDTLNVVLSNGFGKWLGSGSGPVIQHTVPFALRHRPDSCTQFAVRHIMRVDVLDGIEQIGLTFVSKP